jgi:hypothetical protein
MAEKDGIGDAIGQAYLRVKIVWVLSQLAEAIGAARSAGDRHSSLADKKHINLSAK